VLGGGPAGCAAAALLAKRSHKVALVRPHAPPAAALVESIPPSAKRILDELGFLDPVEQAGFQPNRGNSVWWAGEPVRREQFGDGETGWHIDRAGLETVLAGCAAAAGVQVFDGYAARSAIQSDSLWTIQCDTHAGGAMELTTDWLIDATGRKGVIARSEERIPDRSTTTLALVRRFHRSEGWPESDDGHTYVESYDEGWAWSLPVSDTVRCFTAMIDQREVSLEGRDVGEMLDAELRKTQFVGPVRDSAEAVGDAWACPASLYSATTFGRPGLLLTGDAGSFIDPLSSFGVKKALSSGWLAGITAHSALVDPAIVDDAIDFFDRRERTVYRSFRKVSAPFFSAAAAKYGTAYWEKRAQAAIEAAGGETRSAAEVHDRLTEEVPEHEVRAAFEILRAQDRLAPAEGPTVRYFERAGIEGYRIVRLRHVGSDRIPEGLRFVRGVDFITLIPIAQRHPDVPDGWAAYNSAAPPVTLPDYLTALSTAFAAGFLVHSED